MVAWVAPLHYLFDPKVMLEAGVAVRRLGAIPFGAYIGGR
jgi:hypothetical protein